MTSNWIHYECIILLLYYHEPIIILTLLLKIDIFKDSEHMLKNVQKYLVDNNICKKGDQYILIAGVPVGVSGTTNLIRIENI